MTEKRIPLPESLTNTRQQEEVLAIMERTSKLYIGVPKETAFQENRIALTPPSVYTLVANGHRVVIESGAGLNAHFTDHQYAESGAEIAYDTEEVYKAHIILKVAPPTLAELDLCLPNQVIISPIHLPTISDEYLLRLKNKRVIALAIEYIKDKANTFPFVRVMSEMAGISAVNIGAELLTANGQGQGVLLGGISGVAPTKVVILGAGVVAEYATRAVLGLGAEVRVFDNNVRKLMRLQHNIGRRLFTSVLSPDVLQSELLSADLVIGAIHAEIGRSPCVVSEDMVAKMKPNSVIVDISIDQGGCFATSRITTHDKPIFKKYEVIHYCVPNIASRIPRTGSMAFSNIITPLLLDTESNGIEGVLQRTTGLRNGVYAYKGSLTNKYIAEKVNMKWADIKLLLTSGL
jgi:alanine dehydrogenase